MIRSENYNKRDKLGFLFGVGEDGEVGNWERSVSADWKTFSLKSKNLKSLASDIHDN